ncbi:hypothetical protein DdX_04444 [Ditylenchus destructor]|uniref:Uncharacterized protein n=1 Tax=Ditylenchus destructor TaxID=166010 RepID=A0AAD4RAS0_9BILA|nr:hypothetical protein DdX_04444 [Ditylenchus destructor]
MVSCTSFIFSVIQALCILYYFSYAQFIAAQFQPNCADKCRDNNDNGAEKFAQICKWKDYAQCLKDTCSELNESKLPKMMIEVAQSLCGNKTDFFLTYLCRVQIRKHNPSCNLTTTKGWEDYCSEARFSLACLTPMFLQKCNQTAVDIENQYYAYLTIERGIMAIINDPSQKGLTPSEDCEYLINPGNRIMGVPTALIDNSFTGYDNDSSSEPAEDDDTTDSGAGFIKIAPYIMISYLSAAVSISTLKVQEMILFIVINVQLLYLLGHTTLAAENWHECINKDSCKLDPHENTAYYEWTTKANCVKDCMTGEKGEDFGKILHKIAEYAHREIAGVAESFLCRQEVIKDVKDDCEWRSMGDDHGLKDTSLDNYCNYKKFSRDCVSAAINSTCQSDQASYVHDLFDAYIANLDVYELLNATGQTNYTFGNNPVCDDLLKPDRTVLVETTELYQTAPPQEIQTTGEPFNPGQEGSTEDSGAVMYTLHIIGHLLTLLTLISSIF